MPTITPLFENGESVVDYPTKAETFNNYFVSQFNPHNAGDEVLYLPSRTPHGLLSIIFSQKKILTIRALDSNKSSGWDGVFPRMIRICGSSITKPLLIIFETCIREGIFPNMWKMSNVCPIHKKKSKNLKESYKPLSFLPILGKMFEKVLFDEYFINNNLLTPCQSGFIKGDSCVNQLLAITHEIHKNLDANPSTDTIGVFLDMSKAFDKVWHNGLICKLQFYGIQSQLLLLLKNYLF